MGKHAILSPSGADRWMTCPGSVSLSQGRPNPDSSYSAEGSDLHELGAVCLDEGTHAKEYIGQVVLASGVPLEGEGSRSGTVITEDRAAAVQVWLDLIRSYEGLGGSLLIESKVRLTWLTNEPDAEGTLDAAILRTDPELIIADAKYGMGEEVEVVGNRQLMIYAASLLEQHQLWEEYTTVRLVICQPRITTAPKEHVIRIEDLRAFCLEVKKAAIRVDAEPHVLVPSTKACRWCLAKSICPALTKVVEETMLEGLEATDATPPIPVARVTAAVAKFDPTKLAAAMDKTDLFEMFIKAVRAEVERRLLANEQIPGYKLVQGKRGNRKWIDSAEVETMLKSFRMTTEEIFDLSLISPTTAEKRLAKSHPIRWQKVAGMIIQSDGALSVAPEADKRPAISIEAPTFGLTVVLPEDGSDLV
ncbi:MAG: DUF2800 domain-containing protein [Nitrospirales bacterium]|nr:DUF2800 domain-containing protein [Nitrospirales bacterium]